MTLRTRSTETLGARWAGLRAGGRGSGIRTTSSRVQGERALSRPLIVSGGRGNGNPKLAHGATVCLTPLCRRWRAGLEEARRARRAGVQGARGVHPTGGRAHHVVAGAAVWRVG